MEHRQPEQCKAGKPRCVPGARKRRLSRGAGQNLILCQLAPASVVRRSGLWILPDGLGWINTTQLTFRFT
jgi:hypothetical protein